MNNYKLPKNFSLLEDACQHAKAYDIKILSVFSLDDQITLSTDKPFPDNELPLLQLTEV